MLQMRVPSRGDIEAAAAMIEGRVRGTPVIEVDVPVGDTDAPVVLKLELMQHTASFKVRGAFHSVLSAPEPPRRLVAASGGNHGLAVAYAGHELGIPARIFLPETAPSIKVDRLRALGADVTQIGETYAVALAASAEAAAEPGSLALHAYDGWHTVTGQGTLGRELSLQAELDSVLVAVGGGGLLGGVAAWYGRDAHLVAVELPDHWYVDQTTLRILGIGLLMIIAVYLWFCAFAKHRHMTIKGQKLVLPSWKFALAQMLISSVNWMVMGAIIWLLLGPSPRSRPTTWAASSLASRVPPPVRA